MIIQDRRDDVHSGKPQKHNQCLFANNKSNVGGREWMPMAQFEVQWGTDIPSFKGAKKSGLIRLIICGTLVTAGVPKHDKK